MARTALTVKKIDAATLNITTNDTAIDATLVTNGVDITDFFDTREGTRTLLVTNSEASAKNVTISAGPTASAVNETGDLVVAVPASTQLSIGNLTSSKYDQGDGSLYVDFETGTTGFVIGLGEGRSFR